MKDKLLETVSPESVGIPSEVILKYIEKLEKRGVNLHSLLIMRHGKICAEGYWKPYNEATLQRMYSVSKTFTSAAIGLMIDEGRIRLDDRLADFFPEYQPEKPDRYIKDITVEHALKMAVPFTDTAHNDTSEHWVRQFFAAKTNHPSGSCFKYETGGTHVLAALVEKLSGQKLLEYMRPRLLEPIGFSEDTWCVEGTDGYSWGGSGVMATLRDMAKFALVFLQGGKFGGKQLISEEYVKKAVSKQIDNDVLGDGTLWSAGYGYQIWCLPEGAFCFRGMGSQHAICIPDKDLILCCTADTQGALLSDRLIYEGLYDMILPNAGAPLLENLDMSERLLKKCDSLIHKVHHGKTDSPLKEAVKDAAYVMYDNPMGILKVHFSFTEEEGKMLLITDRGEREFVFGFGHNVSGFFPEPGYYDTRIRKPSEKLYPSLASAAWVEENKLSIRVYTIGTYLGNMLATITFVDEKIGIFMSKTAEFFMNEYQGFAGGVREE